MVHIYEARANEVPYFAYKFNYAYSYAHQPLINRMMAHLYALKPGTQTHTTTVHNISGPLSLSLFALQCSCYPVCLFPFDLSMR